MDITLKCIEKEPRYGWGQETPEWRGKVWLLCAVKELLVRSMERIPKRATMRRVLNAHAVDLNSQQKLLQNAGLTALGPRHAENSSGLRDLHARLGLSQKNAPSSKRARQLKLNKEVLILKKMGKI